MIKNTSPDNSGNSESLKNNGNSLKSFQLMGHTWQGVAEGVLQFALFPVLGFKWSVKKHCVVKVLQDILHENNRNCNSYRFSYKFAFIFFLPSYKPRTRIKFSASWWAGNEKYFCFFLIASCALLQRHAEFNILLQRNFLTCHSCLYYSSMIYGGNLKILIFTVSHMAFAIYEVSF